jgi:hypothetical protein
MSLRRAASLVLVLALAACKSATQEPQPADLVFATFSSPNIPSPNDLILAQIPANTPCSVVAALGGGQGEFLCTFVKANGWPNDMELPISIPLSAKHWDPTPTTGAPYGHYVDAAPPTLAAASITASTVAIYRVDVSPPRAVEYDAVASPGLLTLRKKAGANGRRWDAGARYAVAVRGGASGVKTTTGLPINADSAVALIIPNKDLTLTENQPLGAVPDSNGNGTSSDEIASLETLRKSTWWPLTWSNASGAWAPAGGAVTPAFTAISAAFPAAETAVIATFGTAPNTGPVVLIDSGSGTAPLPIDLLRTGAGGKIASNPAFGGYAGGLATLDGFSTTAMVIAQTSVAVDASTVNGANVFLYNLSGATPVLVRELKHELGRLALGDPGASPAAAGYVAEPSAIVIGQGAACPIAGGCSPAIGLQPAAHAPVPGLGNFELPPLPENTLFGVVVTKRVKDALGRPFVRPTVGTIVLEFSKILKTDGVTSDIPGVGNTTAKALFDMQAALAPIWGPGVLPAGTTKADVVTAYTFKTQSNVGVSVSLAAAPYSVELGAGAAIFTPDALPVAWTPPVGVPTTNIAGFYDVRFKSLDVTDKTTGTLRPTLVADLASPTVMPTLLSEMHALVAVPDAAVVPFCSGSSGPRCAKLVVFGHGLNGYKETMVATASSLASKGFVVAAIDFPLHGSRNWCAADANCVLPGTATPGPAGSCDKTGAFAGSAGQGDTVRPGVCAPGTTPSLGDSRYWISPNFFRVRDSFRQNVLDQSALVLALARWPASVYPPQPAANPFASLLLASGIVIDPTDVYYEGISLGSIAGTSVVASNPRFKRAAFAVGGGTLLDIAITSPTFQAQLAPLFTGLIQGFGALPAGTSFSFAMLDPTNVAFNPSVAAAFLQIVNMAKWMMDPGDPINYAQHLRTAPLPDLLANPAGTTPQAAKEVLSQISSGDTVVPNNTSYLLDGLSASHVSFYSYASGAPVPHSIIATDATVQSHDAQFLFDLTVPPAAVTLTP